MSKAEEFDHILDLEAHLETVHRVPDPYRQYDLAWPSHITAVQHVHEYIHEEDEDYGGLTEAEHAAEHERDDILHAHGSS